MRLSTEPRKVHADELRYCVGHLTDPLVKRVITCRNFVLMNPDDRSAKDDLEFVLREWRHSKTYPFKD